jgi:outer membrane protein assembly factor BamB
MHAETILAADAPVEQLRIDVAKPPRPWPALVFVALFWTAFFAVAALDKPYFYGFLFGMAAPAVLALLFFGWWFTRGRIPMRERLYALAVVLGMGVLVAPFCHRSIWFTLVTLGLPIVLTVWSLWMLVAKQIGITRDRFGLLMVVAVTWALGTLVRIDGVNAALQADVRWRWSPSAEDLFLAEKAQRLAPDPAAPPELAAAPVVSAPGDWTGFRGPNRDGVIRGVTIAPNWDTTAPQPLWRQRVGPAWSSVIVIGDRLFTQEQRGEQETVVCYEAATGKEIWVHEDRARFWDAVAGPGPRATPTFDDGRIFTLGGTGILNCLDAATGKRQWSQDITTLANTKPPMWSFSGSPLVVDRLVVVYAGGPDDKGLLAFRAESGDIAWTAPAGGGSYSSPQLATIAGIKQCLMLADNGLTAVDPVTGTVLWQHGLAMPGAPRTAQAHIIGGRQLVAGSLAGPGIAKIEVQRDGNTWQATERWASTQLKTEFPDIVVHEEHAYGFEVGILCCIDLKTGKRLWKGGRYGRGQVMLLADQGALLVSSETGELVLLKANPRKHEELCRFTALDGKTWNHPVVAHGRIYIRNAEEMACYELRGQAR